MRSPGLLSINVQFGLMKHKVRWVGLLAEMLGLEAASVPRGPPVRGGEHRSFNAIKLMEF